jgi:hypothetical protein
MTTRPTPKFVGIDTYIDPKGRFQFRFPMGWHQHALRDKRDGVLFSPEATNPQNWFAVWVTDLKEKIVAEDLRVLRQGLDQGLADLKECVVEEAKEEAIQNLIKFERVFTFRDGEVTRKWRQWLLYVDHWLMVVTYQGENPEEYDYWYAMVNQSFLHFTLPEALWFAVDRDLAGNPRVMKPTSAASSAEGQPADDAG